MSQPDAFAFQHLYAGQNTTDRTLKVRDGDTVLVRSGYHRLLPDPDTMVLPELSGRVVARDGHHRGPAARLDRSTWKETDPRCPRERMSMAEQVLAVVITPRVGPQ